MKAIVAGGAGFIGSHLCERLLGHDFEVVCIDNLSTGRKRNLRNLSGSPGFSFVRANVAGRLAVRGRVDVVFNLASPASPRDFIAHPVRTLVTNSQGTGGLLELARHKGAVFVLASTSEVYGDPAVHPQRESYWGNVNPVGPRSVYDEGKRYAEALTTAYHRKYGLPVRIARIFNTYGPRMRTDDGRVVPNLLAQALTGRPLTIYGSGRQTRSFCYVSDMTKALFRLAGCADPRPVNLGNPEETTMVTLARMILRITSSTSELTYQPLPEDDPRRRRPNIQRARRLLGWKPLVQIEDGLRLTADWMRTGAPPAK